MFATIPALDGYGESEGLPGFTFAEGEMVLPTLDTATGKWYDAQGREVDPSTGKPVSSGAGWAALLGLGLVGAALFFGR